MNDIFQKIFEFKKNGIDLIIITVIEKEGMGPADVGKKMIVTSNNEFFGTVGGGKLEFYAREKCKDIFVNRKSITERYLLYDKNVKPDNGSVNLDMACGGKVTLFYEFVGPKQFVYIFGGGHCGKALLKILSSLDFYTIVIDERENVINECLQYANKAFAMNFVDFIDIEGIKNSSYVVVCTPSHEKDYFVLNKILEKKIHLSYFGMLCSKKKISDYLSKAYEIYGNDIDLNNFYSPIGLDIGGNSPEEIAISISSEILSVFYGKDKKNAHLRDTLPAKDNYLIK